MKPGHPKHVDFRNDDWLDADLDSLESWLVQHIEQRHVQKASALL